MRCARRGSGSSSGGTGRSPSPPICSIPRSARGRTESPGRARRSDARPYGMDGASMGAQERLDRARRAREGPDDDSRRSRRERTGQTRTRSIRGDRAAASGEARAEGARARLAPLSSASKRAAAAATTGRRVVRSKSSLPPGESPPPRSGDDGREEGRVPLRAQGDGPGVRRGAGGDRGVHGG